MFHPPARGESEIMRGQGSRLLRDRHRNAGDFQVDRAQHRAAREEQGLPVAATEADVCCRRLAVNDAAELPALGVEDVYAAGAAAIDVTEGVNLHAVRHARFRPREIGEYAVALLSERTVRREVERADVAAA